MAIEEYKKEISAYRKELGETQRKLNESYDKLVVALSGGSLGLSLTFLKDIADPENIISANWLLAAWALFVISIASILGEILFGISAHKKAIIQADEDSLHREKTGGTFGSISVFLQRLAAIALVLGLISISYFVFLNIGSN